MIRLLCFLAMLAVQPATGQTAEELGERRGRLAAALPEGLVVLKANSTEKAMEQPAWIQNASFQYFSGLQHLPGAILVIDASDGKTTLFAGPAPVSFGQPVRALDVQVNPELVSTVGRESVRPWEEFVPWIEASISSGVAVIYLDEPRRPLPGGVPPGMRPVQGPHALWRQSMEEAFPEVEFESAAASIRELRWAKSEFEIGTLRENARTSAEALRRGMQAVGPGVMQRAAESAVIAGCLEKGAEGPSFWPWLMSGPNAHFGQLIRSFYDNSNLNRAMVPGELVRADVGCAGGGYGGDVGRTVPVSRAFSTEQARVWDLLVTGYQAGIEAMGGGVPLDDVRNASRAAIDAAAIADETLTELARAMNAEDGINWHIHGIGIESGETAMDPLVDGAVIAYEPGFAWGPDAYYLEDMILITETGADVMTRGLPYTSAEVADFLSRTVAVVIETDIGNIVVEVDTENAPVTATNFLRYVDGGLYSEGRFHRSVRMDNQPQDSIRIEVIQGGMSPERRGEGFPAILLEGTSTTGLRHVDGAISMARGGPDTATSSFFICIEDQPDLDEGGLRNPDARGFAAFGQVVEGMDIVRRIQSRPTDGQTLSNPVQIVSIRRR